MTQAIGIVGVLVPSDDLVEALAKEREGGMSDTLVHATVVESFRESQGKSVTLVEGTQGQQTRIRADLSSRKVRANGLMSVEGENQLWYTVCHSWMLRKEMPGSAKPSVHQPFRASFFFYHTNRE